MVVVGAEAQLDLGELAAKGEANGMQIAGIKCDRDGAGVRAQRIVRDAAAPDADVAVTVACAA